MSFRSRVHCLVGECRACPESCGALGAGLCACAGEATVGRAPLAEGSSGGSARSVLVGGRAAGPGDSMARLDGAVFVGAGRDAIGTVRGAPGCRCARGRTRIACGRVRVDVLDMTAPDQLAALNGRPAAGGTGGSGGRWVRQPFPSLHKPLRPEFETRRLFRADRASGLGARQMVGDAGVGGPGGDVEFEGGGEGVEGLDRGGADEKAPGLEAFGAGGDEGRGG